MNSPLLITAITLAFLHTLAGPDHYLPFLALKKDRQWSMQRTLILTALCGLGHVLASVLLGVLGLALGISILKLESLEAQRGDLAAWLLLSFGLAYLCHGIWKEWIQPAQSHRHIEDGPERTTPLTLFIIFIFGPCEVLIPLLMVPAAQNSPTEAALVVTAFGIVTIASMCAAVFVLSRAADAVTLPEIFQRYSRSLAGFVLSACGASIVFLGL